MSESTSQINQAEEKRMFPKDVIQQELDEIRLTLHDIRATKQEKIKPAAWLAFVVWITGITAAGAWQAALVISAIDDIRDDIREIMDDRYRNQDSLRDFTIRDQKIERLEKDFNQLRERVEHYHEK